MSGSDSLSANSNESVTNAMSDVQNQDPLLISPALICRVLEGFIREELGKTGLKKLVVGLSGGIDSGLSLYLAARALGPENVHAIMMPYKTSSPASLGDAQEAVDDLGVPCMVVEITDMVDAYFAKFPDMSKLRRANKMARERLTILYDQSVALGALVLGTSNKTELLLGYGTIYGDMASAINPIGDLYKTQVRQLSKHAGVPRSIIDKPPTADLWPGQSDETELGFTYAEVDQLLYYMVDKRYTFAELHDAGYEPEFVEQVFQRIQKSQYKRRLPLIAKVSGRTIDRDFRYPRDWGQ